MRQTSRAVALLLALDSVQTAAVSVIISAANGYNNSAYQTLLLPYGGNYNGLAGAISSRQAPYNSCPGWVQASATTVANCPAANTTTPSTGQAWTALTAQIAAAGSLTTTANAIGYATAGSLCVPCIQQGGVWCSRTYSYNLATGATVYQTNSSTVVTRSMATAWTAALGVSDNGSCCGTRAGLQAALFGITGIVKTATITASGSDATLLKWNGYACVAWSNIQTTAAAVIDSQVLAAAKTGAKSSWWCSNGLYHQVTASGTNYDDNTVQSTPDVVNQRTELALVGCPQLIGVCGLALADVNTAAGATNVLTIELKVATLTAADKCTFVGFGVTTPPAFSMDKVTVGSASTGIAAASSWTIHHMEYNNNQLAAQASIDYIAIASSLDFSSKVPQFTMGYAVYAKQRTWYGAGTTIYDHANWYSPYNNGQVAATAVTGYSGRQFYGSVASFGSSVAGTDYSNLATTATWDMRVVRYLPVQVAINDNAMGTTAAALYGTQKTAYDSAKTMWNNYVAILTKNAKVDAFAAAFAPPKAPTVPPLPSLPWVPDLSKTMSKLPANKGQSAMTIAAAAIITAGLQPATNQFWIVDDSVPLATGGGWGSFTATVLKYRDAWGKSYGTIGYESTANASFSAMGAVYKDLWQCGTVTGTTTGACPMNYSTATAALANASVAPSVNSVKFYVAVSLWSTQSSAADYRFTTTCASGSTGSCFKLLWASGTWNDVLNKIAAPAAMAAGTAADSLTGIVGAQALAASAAAALAAAAALY